MGFLHKVNLDYSSKNILKKYIIDVLLHFPPFI